MQKRTVRIEIVLPMEFPDDMDDWEINYSLNDGAWCWSNIIRLLEDYDIEHGCICNICEGRVVPEGNTLPGNRTHERR